MVSIRYAPAKVAKTNAWIPLVNKPSRKTGTGIPNGTRVYRTDKVNSSARMFPSSRKLSDNGFENSSRMLSGSKNGTGRRYFVTKVRRNSTSPAKKVACETMQAKPVVVLKSFVGAESSPLPDGSSTNVQGTNAPNQLQARMPVKIAAMSGDQPCGNPWPVVRSVEKPHA